jgi:hypothetical protein
VKFNWNSPPSEVNFLKYINIYRPRDYEKSFFASIGRMGRINSKTIFICLYPENPPNRCKKSASLLCDSPFHGDSCEAGFLKHFE